MAALVGTAGPTSTPFSPAPRPLALAMKSRLPSPLTATADGYHPVGIRPDTCPVRGSMTASEFRPPSATYNADPSGAHANAFGWEPSGPFAPMALRSIVLVSLPAA